MAFPKLDLSFKEVTVIFNEIDKDGSGAIDKKEMGLFLATLMQMQQNLSFKSSNYYYNELGQNNNK